MYISEIFPNILRNLHKQIFQYFSQHTFQSTKIRVEYLSGDNCYTFERSEVFDIRVGLFSHSCIASRADPANILGTFGLYYQYML